ncbi:hypothetical protein Q4E93_10850 [Flavitalea sp. BT771]|uniref:hypothetical protein n=1 Tax=Flavitalea sp. BT771 TaxID=3063329 RepID=UPI0026E42B56|nr:hypothetical protein [Flavitalea sp. BT771]MDO6431089.1 hypothetical protein [Flavitalea sp. BT771]MDV6219996.1 hypothetical protein [Flavitalea sp. BT771]
MLRYLLFFTILIDTARAQDSLTHFNVGVTGNSALNYYGRVDSLHSSAIIPFIGVSFKNGLYLNTNFVFIHNKLQSEYAATLVEGGYNFRNKKNSWAGNLSATRYFYQDNTDLIQSAVKQSITVSLTHLNKILNITLGGDVKFSNQADPGVQAGLDHIVRWTKVFHKGVVVLDPSAYVYAGTQHFTQTYLQQKNFLFLPAGQEELTKEGRQFSVLSYELSLPVVFAWQKFVFILSPAYVLPQHLLTTDEAKDLFYTTATVKFTF